MRVRTGYAIVDDQSIAYQVIGEGPGQIVYAIGARAPFDAEWDEPNVRAFYGQFDGFAQSVRFDQRGIGASTRSGWMPCRHGSRWQTRSKR
jgi:hypothetical protein